MFTTAFWGGLAIFSFSAYFVRHSLAMMKDYEPSKRWPQAEGTILRSEATHSSSYSYWLEYEYQVDGKTYKGIRFALYTLSTECVWLAEKITGIKQSIVDHHKELRPLPKEFKDQFETLPLKTGDRVRVYYKPNAPQEAILLPGPGPKKHSDLILSLIGLCIGVGVMLGDYFDYFDK